MTRPAVFLSILAALAAPFVAHDAAAQDCQQECVSYCGVQDTDGGLACGICKTGCENRRRGNGARGAPAPAPPSAQWGYIVFDTATGRWGSTAGQRVGVEARGLAREGCRRAGGQRCDWNIPIQQGCIAVVEGRGAVGRAAHQKSGNDDRALADATSKALAVCRQQGGQQCQRVAAVCSWDQKQRP